MHHHTAQIQSPRSMVMRGVTLQYTVRSQQPFIRNFAQAFKGILKINMNSYCIKKGYIFIFAAKSLDKKKIYSVQYDTAQYDTAQSQFFLY